MDITAEIPRFTEGQIATTTTVNRLGDSLRPKTTPGHGNQLRHDQVRKQMAVVASVDDSGAMPWPYELYLVYEGGPAPSGLSTDTSVSYRGYCRWEIDLVNAGYENTNIGGILALPVGAPVEGTWIERDDQTIVLSFSERHEPYCTGDAPSFGF